MKNICIFHGYLQLSCCKFLLNHLASWWKFGTKLWKKVNFPTLRKNSKSWKFWLFKMKFEFFVYWQTSYFDMSWWNMILIKTSKFDFSVYNWLFHLLTKFQLSINWSWEMRGKILGYNNFPCSIFLNLKC